jgi:transposase-like protein
MSTSFGMMEFIADWLEKSGLAEEIRRRTYVVRIFPNTESCLRLVRALAVETHEKLDGGQPLHQYGRPARAQETRTPSSRMTSLMTAQFCRT